MSLERKPVEESQEPGYPSTQEYVTGRRAFMGLLGLTALGVGGVYLLKRRPEAAVVGEIAVPKSQSSGLVAPPKAQPPVVAPQSHPSGIEAPPEPPQPPVQPVGPARPEAQSLGDVDVIEEDALSPVPPDARPVAPPPGAPPRPQPNGPAPDAPQAPAQPVAPSLGSVAPKPAVPQAVIRGEAIAPAQPLARTEGKPKSPE